MASGLLIGKMQGRRGSTGNVSVWQHTDNQISNGLTTKWRRSSPPFMWRKSLFHRMASSIGYCTYPGLLNEEVDK